MPTLTKKKNPSVKVTLKPKYPKTTPKDRKRTV